MGHHPVGDEHTDLGLQPLGRGPAMVVLLGDGDGDADGKLYCDEQMRREIAGRRRSLTALFNEAKRELRR